MDERIDVLHVDDDPAFAEMAAEFLERGDDRLSVRTENSAAAGLERLAEGGIDCIVSDYDMPGMNGVEFLRAVREDHPELPFILFTGKGSEEVAAEAVDADVSGYIQKRGTDTYDLLASRIGNEVEDYRLTTSYRRYETVVESLTDPVYVTDEDGEFTQVNDAFLELVGYDEATVIGSDPALIKDPDAVAETERQLERLLAEESADSVLFEVDIRTADGRSVPCENHMGVVPFEGGRFRGVVGVLRDVSTRQASEQFRRDLYDVAGATDLAVEERCRRMLRLGCERLGVDEGKLVRTDRDAGTHETVVAARDDAEEGTVAELSRTYCRRVVDSGDPVAFHDAERAGWDDDPAAEAYGHACYAGAEVTVDGEQYGTICFFSSESRPVSFTDAELTFVELVSQRVGQELERERSRESLRERERTLRKVYDVVSDRSLGTEDRIRQLLEIGRETLGTGYAAVSEINGDQYRLDLLAPSVEGFDEGETLPLSSTACERTIATQETLAAPRLDDDDRFRRHPVHTEFGFGCYIGTPVYRNEELHGTVCFLDQASRDRPFSDWETTLVELIGQWVNHAFEEDARREAITRERDRLDRFAGVVSHDLRNPISVARGHVEMAHEGDGGDHLETALRALDRADTLIEDLLALSREGERVSEFTAVDLAALADDSWRTVAAGDARLQIETDRTIRADRDRLRQVLENLFRNSAEHGSAGSRQTDDAVTVRVGDLEDGFYVADDGPGIPEADRELVFESRYTTASDGTGFGLTIVREIVEAHGWTITATGSEAGGARFEIHGVTAATRQSAGQ